MFGATVAENMTANALSAWLAEHDSFAEIKKIKILDPSCGDGEFLISALKKLIEIHKKFQAGLPENEIARQIIKNNLYGIDCDANALNLLQKHNKLLVRLSQNKEDICLNSLSI